MWPKSPGSSSARVIRGNSLNAAPCAQGWTGLQAMVGEVLMGLVKL